MTADNQSFTRIDSLAHIEATGAVSDRVARKKKRERESRRRRKAKANEPDSSVLEEELGSDDHVDFHA